MKLFKYEGYKVIISEEALLLKPFKDIWNRDKSKNKSTALQELGFIYFMEDPRSDYQYIVDINERQKAIMEGEGLSDKWKPDKLIKEAMKFYETFKSTGALLLEDTRFAVDKLRKLLRDIDLSKTDDHEKPIYTLNTITSTIKQIPDLIKELDNAERAITTEMKSGSRMRGSGEKTLFDDGIKL
jgi:uncharacterized protein YoxC